MAPNFQEDPDFALYCDLTQPAPSRIGAAQRLASTWRLNLCEHYAILELGPCSFCPSPEKLEKENRELKAENEELQREIARLKARLAEGTWKK